MKTRGVGEGGCAQGQRQFAHPCLRPRLGPFEVVRHGVCTDVWVQSPLWWSWPASWSKVFWCWTASRMAGDKIVLKGWGQISEKCSLSLSPSLSFFAPARGLDLTKACKHPSKSFQHCVTWCYWFPGSSVRPEKIRTADDQYCCFTFVLVVWRWGTMSWTSVML